MVFSGDANRGKIKKKKMAKGETADEPAVWRGRT
jgi:hypothetical protein